MLNQVETIFQEGISVQEMQVLQTQGLIKPCWEMLDQLLWNKIYMDVPLNSFKLSFWKKEKEEVEVQLSLIKWLLMNKQVNNLETKNTQSSDERVLKE